MSADVYASTWVDVAIYEARIGGARPIVSQ